MPGAFLTAVQCGAKSDNITDNHTVFQNGINALIAGYGGGEFHIPASYTPGNPGAPNYYLLAAQVNLPTFSTLVAGKSWDEGNPLKITGDGPVQTGVRFTGTGYAFAQTTIGATGTTNRGQNAGVEISGFSLMGPQSWTNQACGLGLDNTTAPSVHDMWFEGFVGTGNTTNPVGGCAIEIYAYTTGGSFGAHIFHNRFGIPEFTTENGLDGNTYSVYDPAVLEQVENRYAVWLNGPYQANGKVNDVNFTENRCEDYLIGCIRIQGNVTAHPP